MPKIGDFGLTKKTQSLAMDRFKTKCGTTGYMAPEMMSRTKYDGVATDVFALGVVLFNMVFGNIPFHKAGDKMHKTLDKDPVFYCQQFKYHNVNIEIMNIVSMLTHIDSRKRP